jgi:outer membrane protein TolC
MASPFQKPPRPLENNLLYINVLSAQQALGATQQRFIVVRFESIINDITLYQALGGGWK